MASTNKTTNLELSQFLGTDKPSWLGDYNTDMTKIDTAVHTASATATGADGKADANATAIGTLTNLTTDVKTDLVSAINEVDSHADSATTTATQATATATSALTTATTANNGVTALANFLNLSSVTNYTTSSFTITSGGGSFASASQSFTIARNNEGSLCKVYGAIQISGATVGQTLTIKLNANTGLTPTEAFTVTGTGFGDSSVGITNLNIKFNTDGTLEFSTYVNSSNVVIRPMACLIFVKNFGDEPEE